jgi:hypothetical protein
MNERIQKLKDQIKELQAWKLSNSIQQIPFNPPVNTTRIMQDGMLVATGKTATGTGLDIYLEVSFDGDLVLIPAKLQP